ncbi:MAG: hypothetical protein V4719_10200 [Planctomycetota bacterium]
MKVTVSRTHCLDAMKAVAGLVYGKPAVGDKGDKKAPRKNVRLDVSADGLRIFGGEKEGFAIVSLPARKGEPFEAGSALAPPWKLIEILSAAKGDDIRLFLNWKEALSVTTRDGTFQIESGDVDLFPLQTPSDLPWVVSAYAAPLRLALQRTVFAADREESDAGQAAYDLVCFDIANELMLCASDGGNLSIARVPDAKRPEGRQPNLQLAIPRAAAADLLALIPSELQQIEISHSPGLACFAFRSHGMPIRFFTSLIQRRLPSYLKVVPPPTGPKWAIESAALASAGNLTKAFDSGHGITVKVSSDTWRFEAEKAAVGNAWVEIAANGPDGRTDLLKLPPRLLAKVAEACAAPSLEVMLGGPRDPLVFRCECFTFVMSQMRAVENVPAVKVPEAKPKAAKPVAGAA